MATPFKQLEPSMSRLTRVPEESQMKSAPEWRQCERSSKKARITGPLQPGGQCALIKRPNRWTAEEKARWLAELADAIDDAQQLVWQISASGGDRARASALYGQLEAAREEIDRLRRGTARAARLEVDPKWRDLLDFAVCELVGHTPTGMSPPPEKG